MKKLLFSVGLAIAGITTVGAQPSMLFVHNSPDPALAEVDVWGEAAGGLVYVKLIDDLQYTQGAVYTFSSGLPAGSVTLHVKAATSTVESDPDIFSRTFPTLPTNDFVAVASGFLDSSPLIASVTNPNGVNNELDIYFKEIPLASTDPTKASVVVHQGVVSLDSVYFQSFITTIQSTPREILAHPQYGDISEPYLSDASPRRVHLNTATGAAGTVIYPSNGDLLKNYAGKSVFIVSTGFQDTTGTNSTNTLKVLAYVTDAATLPAAGVGAAVVSPVEFQREKIAGKVRVFHNVADPRLDTFDLYVGGIKQILGLSFRQGFESAAFIQDFDYNIGLHEKGVATAAFNEVLRLTSDSLVAEAIGVIDPNDFADNPDGEDLSVQLVRHSPTNYVQPAGTTKVTFFHGAPDAPTFDVTLPALGGLALINDLGYGSSQTAVGTSGTDLSTSFGTVIVDLKNPDGSVFKSYLVPLSSALYEGKAVAIFASGFIDPSANQNGESFKLFLGNATGSPIIAPIFLTDTTITTSINDPSKSDLQFRMFPNPATTELTLAFDVKEKGNVVVDILDITGRVVKHVTDGEFIGRVAMTEDVSMLNSGTYITRVTSANKTSAYKFNVVR